MSFSSPTLNTFAVPANQIPAAPTYVSVVAGASPGTAVVTVNVPSVDTFAVALTPANVVKLMTLFYSENVLPATTDELYALPTNLAIRIIATAPPTPSTVVFNISSLIPAQNVYLAVVADNS